MKILVTGSREASQGLIDSLLNWLENYKNKTDVEIIVGDAEGIDESTIIFCDNNNIPITVYGAYNKVRHKTKTGKNIPTNLTYPQRDELMAKLCDSALAYWNGISSGTVYTYKCVMDLGKPVLITTERDIMWKKAEEQVLKEHAEAWKELADK